MTKEEMENRAATLALEHWHYIEELLDAHRVGMDEQGIAEFHYLEAFKHGYKHCWEDEINSIEYTCKVPGQVLEIKR